MNKMDEILNDVFEDQLTTVFDKLRNRTDFIIFNDEPARNRHKSFEYVVESLCLMEKCPPHKRTISLFTDMELFLKLVLEKNASLFVYENEIFKSLGIKRDRSGISLPQKTKIAVQATAQVLWYLHKGKIPTIEKMQNFILNKTNPFFDFLEINRFTTSLNSSEGPLSLPTSVKFYF